MNGARKKKGRGGRGRRPFGGGEGDRRPKKEVGKRGGGERMWRRLGSGMVGPLFLLSPGLPRLSQFDRGRREGTVDRGREIGRKEKGGREQSGYKTIAVGRMISYGSRPPPPPLPSLFLLRKGRSDEKESDISSFFLRWAYKAGETPFPPSSPNVESVCSSSSVAFCSSRQFGQPDKHHQSRGGCSLLSFFSLSV